MNGRVQDPKLGKFVSADPYIQAPYHTQSHNRLAYVMNNPATLVDPSGFQWTYDPIFGDWVNPGIAGTLSPFEGQREFGDWSQIWDTSVSDPSSMFDGPENYPSFGKGCVYDPETGEVVMDWGEFTKDFIRAQQSLAELERQGGSRSIGPITINWKFRDNFAGRMLQSGDAQSIAVGVSPAGIYADLYTAGTGQDYFSGEEVTGIWRWLVLIPGISEIRRGDNVLDAARGITQAAQAKGDDFFAGFARRNPSNQTTRRIGDYTEFSIEVPGENGRSFTRWVKVVGGDGRTIRMYHDTFDSTGRFRGRGVKVPGPERHAQ
jgi:hypothetical protein